MTLSVWSEVPIILSAAVTVRCRVGGGAASEPHSDAGAEDVFSGTSVERVHEGFAVGSREALGLSWPCMMSEMIFWCFLSEK